MSTEAGAATAAAALGALFRERRQAVGLSSAQVAAALRLERELVEAIEDGRFERLPGGPYGRGYVGGYARLLKLDADEMAARFDAAGGSAPIKATVRVPLARRSRMAELAEHRLGLVFGGVVIVLLLGAGAVLWSVWRNYEWPFIGGDATLEETAPQPAAEPARLDAPAAEGAAAADEADVADAEQAAATAPGDAAAQDVDAAEDQAATAADAAAGATRQAAEAAAEPDEIVLVGSDEPFLAQVTFTFSGDSWVEVTDGGEQTIHADLGRDGQQVTVEGEPPLSLLIGYAPAVTVTYNGDAVALEPHTRDAVARLVVGR